MALEGAGCVDEVFDDGEVVFFFDAAADTDEEVDFADVDVVAPVDPGAMLSIFENHELDAFAEEVGERMDRAINQLPA